MANGTNATATRYTKEGVSGRIDEKELEELNHLVDKFGEFSKNENDPRYLKWKGLDKKASGS